MFKKEKKNRFSKGEVRYKIMLREYDNKLERK